MIRRIFAGRIAVAVASAMLVVVAASAPAYALSKDAQTIVNQVKANVPTLKPVCSDRGKLTTAVTSATIALAKSNKIQADEASARSAGQEAGRYLYFHCS